jgi:hypothetical protein
MPRQIRKKNSLNLWGQSFNSLQLKEKASLLASHGFRKHFAAIPNSSEAITKGFTNYDGYRSHNNYFILKWKSPGDYTISQPTMYALEFTQGSLNGARIIVIRSVQRVGEEQCKDPTERAKLLGNRDQEFKKKFGIHSQTYAILRFLFSHRTAILESLFSPKIYLYAPSNPEIHGPIRDKFFMRHEVKIKIYDRRNTLPGERALVTEVNAYPLNITKPLVASLLFNLPDRYIPTALRKLFAKP